MRLSCCVDTCSDGLLIDELSVRGAGGKGVDCVDLRLQPVEDLMLSSIHAFSVELRLASESVLSKVK